MSIPRRDLSHASKLDVFVVEGFDGQADSEAFGHEIVVRMKLSRAWAVHDYRFTQLQCFQFRMLSLSSDRGDLSTLDLAEPCGDK